ncbi:MAG: cellulase family glycosylhydrolase [Planctomycetota bacterium]
MKKTCFITAMFLMALISSASYGVTPAGPLSVSGNRIVNQYGQPVSFAGMSFFWSNDGWGGSKYYNADCLNWLVSDWGVTIVRAAMGVEDGGGYIGSPTNNKNRVITIVDASIAAGIYVLIDWHSHNAEDYESEAIAFFEEMATTYGGYDNVIYEIYNEPLSGCSWPNDIKPYAEAVIAAIRAIDPDNLIVVGSPEWSQRVDLPAGDPITGYINIAYTIHFYPDMGHTQWLRDRASSAMNAGIALMVTEWGPKGMAWMDWCDLNYVSHTAWAVNDKDEPWSILDPWIGMSTGGWSEDDLSTRGQILKDICLNWDDTPPPQPEGDNLALNQPAFSSSDESGSSGPEKAVDGSGSTRWSSQFSDPQWIYVDLGEQKAVDSVQLNWEAAYATAYQIQVSDDASAWADVYSTSSGNGGIDTIDIGGVVTRYVRMYGTQRATSYGYSLWEFGIYGCAGTFQEADGACVMEAENAAVNQRSDNITWSSATGYSGYIGSSYMTAPDNTGSSVVWSTGCELAWDVEISTAGTYYMAVRRLALDNGDDSATVGVGGNERDDNTFNGPTGSAWQWSRGTDFDLGSLSAGIHTIQIRRREDGFCVDRVMIADSWSKLPADGSTEVGPDESPKYKSGDFDKDCDVDAVDLARQMHFWLTNESSVDIAPADAPDGIVNFLDLAIIAKNWRTGTTIPSLYELASNPNPGDGAIGVITTDDLSWTAGLSATSHDVYFGTSNPPPFIQNQTSTTFEPGTMTSGARYYWRIDEVYFFGTFTGVVWSFNTQGGGPG